MIEICILVVGYKMMKLNELYVVLNVYYFVYKCCLINIL